MAVLGKQTLVLIAIGASVSANCQPCLERNLATAMRCGVDQAQIADAIDIGKRVRQGAASKMDQHITGLGGVEAVAECVEGCKGGVGSAR